MKMSIDEGRRNEIRYDILEMIFWFILIRI